MLRAIREIQPTWVIGENVSGLVNWSGGLVFEQIQAELEAEGYEVQPYLLPACGVDAPHKRERVWFVAHSGSNRVTQKDYGWEKQIINNRQNLRDNINTVSDSKTFTNTGSEQLQERTQDNISKNREKNKTRLDNRIKRFVNFRITSNTGHIELQRGKFNGSLLQKREIEEQGGQLSRPICTTWENFPTQSPICSGNDGIPDRLDNITFPKWRNESIKGYGNAIVPQVALQIFNAINEFEQLTKY